MIWIVIAGSAVATYVVRATPLALSLRVALPPWARRYLETLPIAIIAALVGPGIALPGGAPTHGAEPVAAALALAAVAWRRNLLVGVLVGVAAVALLRAVL